MLLATVRMSVMVISCFFVHLGCRISLRTSVRSNRARGREERQGGEEMRTVCELLNVFDVEQKGGKQTVPDR